MASAFSGSAAAAMQIWLFLCSSVKGLIHTGKLLSLMNEIAWVFDLRLQSCQIPGKNDYA